VSALLSLKTRLQRMQKIKPGSFWPKPEVDSMVIKILPLETPWVDPEERYKKIKEFTRAIFAYRRKTWFKSLRMCYKSIDLSDFLLKMEREGFPTGKRAQELNIKDIERLGLLFNAFLQERKPGNNFSSN
jgi:16S rRNA (adenine1518-N6/adenine1519-N6)-dimethyltransferase